MATPGMTTVGATAALDTSLNTIISEFRLLADEKPVMRDRATELTLEPGEGTSKLINNYGRVTASGVSDGVDISNAQALADAQTSFTPSEVAVQVILSGRALTRSADRTLLSRTSQIIRNAMALKIDQDGTAQLPSFVPIVGSAGTVMSIGLLAAAVARAQIGNDRTNPEPYNNLSGVFNPLHMLTLAGTLVPYSSVPTGTAAYGSNTGAHGGVTLTNGGGTGDADALSNQIIRNGPRSIGQLQGVPIFLDANCAVDASDDCSGAVFDRMGLNFISEVEMRLDPDTSDKSMRGAVEANAWASYVYGLYRPSNSGVEVLADCSLPTS